MQPPSAVALATMSSGATIGWLTHSLRYSGLPGTPMFLAAFRSACSCKPQRLQWNDELFRFAWSACLQREQLCDVWYGLMKTTDLPTCSALYRTNRCSSAKDQEPSLRLKHLPLLFLLVICSFSIANTSYGFPTIALDMQWFVSNTNRLSSAYPLEVALGGASAYMLEPPFKVLIFAFHGPQTLRVEEGVVRADGNIHDPTVNTEDFQLLYRSWCHIRQLYLDIQKRLVPSYN